MRLCKEILVSESVHDFKTCKCGEISVDGGTDYIRRCYTTDRMNIIELSEFVDENKNVEL